jgi:thrombospondin type 3 repeat protein
MARLRHTRGQTSAELLGALLLVAVIIAAIVTAGVPDKVACKVSETVQKIAGDERGACGDGQEQTAQDVDNLRDEEGGGAPPPPFEGGDIDDNPQTPPDADGDGVSDGDEARNNTNPNNPDTDGDGLSDFDEQRLGGDPRSNDGDGDGLTDTEEAEFGTDPSKRDSDGDGLSDGEELDRDTDPTNGDTDGDGDNDGQDDDPLTYDGSFGDALAGALCGSATALWCPGENDPSRATPEYVFGEIITGIFAVGDVRDAIGALLNGDLAEAGLSVLGIVPVAGDAIKVGRKVRDVINKFPGQRKELLGLLFDLFPDGALRREALDAATDGGYSALRNSGLSDDAVEQLARKGNDLRRLADNARIGRRKLDPTEAQNIENEVNRRWPAHRRAEAYGVETALAELRRDPNIEILYDGRPRPGTPIHGPDIVAIDKRTGRPIIVEAKGTQGGRPLSGRSIQSTAANQRVTQTSPDWLRNNPRRYLDALRNSPNPNDRRTAEVLESIIGDRKAGYDVRIVNSRPSGRGGYGSGLDDAVDNIRQGGQVGDVNIIDVERP